MFRKLIIAGALLGPMATAALAEDYYVLQLKAGESAECIVVPRPPKPEADEVKVGGPYASKEKAEEEMQSLPTCQAD